MREHRDQTMQARIIISLDSGVHRPPTLRRKTCKYRHHSIWYEFRSSCRWTMFCSQLPTDEHLSPCPQTSAGMLLSLRCDGKDVFCTWQPFPWETHQHCSREKFTEAYCTVGYKLQATGTPSSSPSPCQALATWSNTANTTLLRQNRRMLVLCICGTYRYIILRTALSTISLHPLRYSPNTSWVW
jgi:hypothetical protein